MSAPTITKGYTWASGATVTPSRLNDLVDDATLGFTQTNVLAGRSTAGAGTAEEIACTAAGRALLDDATAADQRTTLGLGSMATQVSGAVAITGGEAALTRIVYTDSTITFASPTVVDFGTGVATFQTLTLGGDLIFSTTNLASGRLKVVRIIGDGSTRNLTFPSWVVVGTAFPATLAASKTLLVVVLPFGTLASQCVACAVVEP